MYYWTYIGALCQLKNWLFILLIIIIIIIIIIKMTNNKLTVIHNIMLFVYYILRFKQEPKRVCSNKLRLKLLHVNLGIIIMNVQTSSYYRRFYKTLSL